MPEWITDLFSRVVGPKTSLPLFLASALILFAPANIADVLGMKALREEYALPLGLLLVFSACMLVSSAILSLRDLLLPMVRDRLWAFSRRGSLRNLTEAEKTALRPYIFDGQAEVSFRLGNGVVNLLERKMILMRAANIATFHDHFDYIMQPWAREYLQNHKYLLR